MPLPSLAVFSSRVLYVWPQLTVSLCFLTGYGERGAPPKIPGNTLNTLSHRSPRVPDPSLITLLPPGGATLVFEVELLKIERRSEL